MRGEGPERGVRLWEPFVHKAALGHRWYTAQPSCQHSRGMSLRNGSHNLQRWQGSVRVFGLASQRHRGVERNFRVPNSPSNSQGPGIFKTVLATFEGRAHNRGSLRGLRQGIGRQIGGLIHNVCNDNVCNDGIAVVANPVNIALTGVEQDNCKPSAASRPLGSLENFGRANAARPKVLHVFGEHPDVCISGVIVDAFDCPGNRVAARAVKDAIGGLNEATLVNSGNSNVLFTPGSLLVGRRGARASAIMRDMVSCWLTERWFVIVYIGVDRTLANGVSDQLKEVGFFLRCLLFVFVRGSWESDARHDLFNCSRFARNPPTCVNCHANKHAIDEHWELKTSQ